MMRSTRNTILIYAALLSVAGVLLFPFYWVVSSSVKTRECMKMNPPPFYPCRDATRRIEFDSDGRIISANETKWFRLIDAPSPETSKPGAYYIALEDEKPTNLVGWFGADEVESSSISSAVVFEAAELRKVKKTKRKVVELASMVRQLEETDASQRSYDELLFVVPESATAISNVEILKNVKYTKVREFFARWKNYAETLKGAEATYGQKTAGFLVYLRNSFFISFVAVVGQIFGSSLAAFGFARLRFRGRNFLFIIVLATMMIPAQVTLIPLFTIFKEIGWLNTFLPLTVPNFCGSAFFIFLLRQYMLTLPYELDESAAIDGCGPFRTFFSVILPNCMPAIILVGLFTFIGSWQNVLGPLIYLDSPSLRTVTLGLEYFRSPIEDNSHLLMTGSVLAMLPVAVIFCIFQRYIMAGIATTGIKG